MSTELTVTFKQARNYHQGRVASPRLIVIHFAVTPEYPTSAEGVQSFFAGAGAPQASAHVCADSNSLARSVHDWDTAWGAPGANADGLHLEQAGDRQTRQQWLDTYSRAMIESQAARQVADWSGRYAIPLRKLTVGQVADGHSKGVCGHHDVTKAFPGLHGTHTDPDPDYPYDVLLAAAEHLLGSHPQPAPHVVRNPYPQPRFIYDRHGRLAGGAFTSGASDAGHRVRFVQWALALTVDGDFGPKTLAAVRAFQKRQHIAVDGFVGPETARLLAAITHLA